MKIELTDEAVIGDHIDKRIGGRMQTSIRLNERQAKEIQKRAEQINVSAHAMMLMLMELGMKLMDSGITLNLSDDPVSDTIQCFSKESIRSER